MVNESAAQILSRRTSNKIAIVSVFGPTGSGKSSFLNQLLKVQGAFQEHHSQLQQSESVTRGLWIYADPITIEKEGEVFDIFFVDSEGIDGTSERRDAYESNPDQDR